jgi:hypothetical protein
MVQAQNKIVVHYQDGRILKGTTADFFPNKERFHVNQIDAPVGSKPVEVLISQLKAIFFVKDYKGQPERDGVRPVQAAHGSEDPGAFHRRGGDPRHDTGLSSRAFGFLRDSSGSQLQQRALLHSRRGDPGSLFGVVEILLPDTGRCRGHLHPARYNPRKHPFLWWQ